MSFYVSTANFVLLHCDEWDGDVALPRHKFVTGATLLQLRCHRIYIYRFYHIPTLRIFFSVFYEHLEYKIWNAVVDIYFMVMCS